MLNDLTTQLNEALGELQPGGYVSASTIEKLAAIRDRLEAMSPRPEFNRMTNAIEKLPEMMP